MTLLDLLGYDVLGGLADLVASSLWSWVLTLVLIGFVSGRLLDRALLRKTATRRL